jgi:hypothetical protein
MILRGGNIMRRRTRYHPLRLWAASFVLFAGVVMWALPEMGRLYRYDTILSVNIVSGIVLALAVLGLLMLVMTLVLYAKEQGGNRIERGIAKAALLAMFSGISFVALLAVSGPLVGESLPMTHITSIFVEDTQSNSNDHVYQLAYHHDYIDGAFQLYECDSLGIICHLVHRQVLTWELGPTHQPRLPPPDSRLYADFVGRVILEVEGKVAYTHQVED